MIRTSGLIGMSPNPFDEESDLFIVNMKESGIVDDAIFSLSIGMKGSQCRITFGGYNLEAYSTADYI